MPRTNTSDGRMIRRLARLEAPSTLADLRQVRVVASDESLGRDELELVNAGVGVSNYRRNPCVLWAHDDREVIARCAEIGVVGDRIEALIQFPPAGVCRRSDEVLGLVQAGCVNAVSIGFDPLRQEPLDESRPYDGARILESELMEISFVSIPALPSALVLERSRRGGRGKPARALSPKHLRMAALYKGEAAARKPKPSTKRARPPSRSPLATHRLRALRYQGELRLR